QARRSSPDDPDLRAHRTLCSSPSRLSVGDAVTRGTGTKAGMAWMIAQRRYVSRLRVPPGGIVAASSDDRERPAPAYRPRPAPDVPGGLAVADREEDDLGFADDILERYVADRRQHTAIGRVVAIVAHHEIVAGR